MPYNVEELILYEEHIEVVGKLIIGGIWLSDATAIATIILGPLPHRNKWGLCDDDITLAEERFESDVNKYVDKSGQTVPLPKYKNIF